MYCNRVLIGNWYDSQLLEEFETQKIMKSCVTGNSMLSKSRLMSKNLDAPRELTQSIYVSFGDKVSLLAPYIETSPKYNNGVMLGGRLSVNNILNCPDLVEDCKLAGLCLHTITARNTFVVASADYCDRKGEFLKYGQEFLLCLESSMNKKPLYVRYDAVPCPGVSDDFSLFFSHNPVSNTRWRALAIENPNITKFEMEGKNILVNEDIVINHCATNLNLGLNINKWAFGFHGLVCVPEMKTCLDIYKREMPNNIWKFYVPQASAENTRTHRN